MNTSSLSSAFNCKRRHHVHTSQLRCWRGCIGLLAQLISSSRMIRSTDNKSFQSFAEAHQEGDSLLARGPVLCAPSSARRARQAPSTPSPRELKPSPNSYPPLPSRKYCSNTISLDRDPLRNIERLVFISDEESFFTRLTYLFLQFFFPMLFMISKPNKSLINNLLKNEHAAMYSKW